MRTANREFISDSPLSLFLTDFGFFIPRWLLERVCSVLPRTQLYNVIWCSLTPHRKPLTQIHYQWSAMLYLLPIGLSFGHNGAVSWGCLRYSLAYFYDVASSLLLKF